MCWLSFKAVQPHVWQAVATSQWDVSWGGSSKAASYQTTQGTERDKNSEKAIVYVFQLSISLTIKEKIETDPQKTLSYLEKTTG